MVCRLHFYDISKAGREVRLTPSSGLYGVLERQYLIYNTAGLVVPDFRSSEPRMKIDYLGKPTDVYNGFRLLITTFFGTSFSLSKYIFYLLFLLWYFHYILRKRPIINTYKWIHVCYSVSSHLFWDYCTINSSLSFYFWLYFSGCPAVCPSPFKCPE